MTIGGVLGEQDAFSPGQRACDRRGSGSSPSRVRTEALVEALGKRRGTQAFVVAGTIALPPLNQDGATNSANIDDAVRRASKKRS